MGQFIDTIQPLIDKLETNHGIDKATATQIVSVRTDADPSGDRCRQPALR